MCSEILLTPIKLIDNLVTRVNADTLDSLNASIEEIVDKIEDIAFSAGEANLLGIQDICMLMKEHILDAQASNHSISPAQYESFNHWLQLTKEYLTASGDHKIVEALLKVFNEECWDSSMTQTDFQILQDMLIGSMPEKLPEESTNNMTQQFSQNSEIQTVQQWLEKLFEIAGRKIRSEDQYLQILSQRIKQFTQLGNISPVFSKMSLILDENIDALIANNYQLSEVQEILLISWINLAEKFIQAEDKDIGKALLKNMQNPHWLLPLSDQDMADMVGMMDTVLDEDNATDNTSDNKQSLINELQHSVLQYELGSFDKLVNIIEKFNQLIEQIDLPGFSDICMLFQQNLEELYRDKKPLSEAQYWALIDWTDVAEAYLKNPADKNLAASIIEYLTDNQWPIFLKAEDTMVFKEIFGIEEEFHSAGNQLGNRQTNIFPDQQAETEDLQTAKADTEISDIEINEIFLVSEEQSRQEKIEDSYANKVSIDESVTSADGVISASEMPAKQAETEDLQTVKADTEISDIEINEIFPISEEQSRQEKIEDSYANKASIDESVTSADGVISASEMQAKQAETEDLQTVKADTEISDIEINEISSISEEQSRQEKIEDSYANKVSIDESVTSTDGVISASEMQAKQAETEGLQIHKVDAGKPSANVDEVVSLPNYQVSRELAEMLITEVIRIVDEMQGIDLKISSQLTEKIVRYDEILKLATWIERFGSACEAAEIKGLHKSSEILKNNILLIADADALATTRQCRLINDWLETVKDYLGMLGDEEMSKKNITILQSDSWEKPVTAEISSSLLDLLKAPYFGVQEMRVDRKATATDEDVSIALPADINQELLEGLLLELPTQTEDFSKIIHSIVESGGNKNEEMRQAQRIAHTVKGAANTVGIVGIANLTHYLEDIFIILNKHNKLPSSSLATVLIESADCLEEMSEALLHGGTLSDNALQVFQEILNWIILLEDKGISILDDEKEESSASFTVVKKKVENGHVNEKQEKMAESILRVPAKIIDNIIRILGESMIVTSQLQEKIKHSVKENRHLLEQNNALNGLVSLLEKQVEISGINRDDGTSDNQNDDSVFDPLELEQYNELHTLSNRLAESALDSMEVSQDLKYILEDLDELIIRQTFVQREIQGLVMRTRMIPIDTIISRLQRSVRQTCRVVGKQAILELSGTETLIDSNILNEIVDPLIHILRNSIDHGIEKPEERIKKAKDPTGNIKLMFISQGTHILIRCIDDGAGLNRENILKIAIEKGIVESGEELSDNEINRLILQHGFSTSQQTTQVSGRGIGMDLVYTKILRLKGTLYIESELDKGCLIEMRLPLSLISSHVFLIRHRSNILAISSRGIEKILHPTDSEIIETEKGLQCKVDDQLIDMKNLEDLIDIPGDRRLMERESRTAFFVNDQGSNIVVFLQEIIESRELIIKPLGKYLKNLESIAGATILGDGTVIPVLDILELLRTSHQKPWASERTIVDIGLDSLPVALVVDDSLSTRRALAQVVRDAGYEARMAKDGIEATEIMDKKMPDILLVDMEMPRMNGMELTAQIRSIDSMKHIPVIMITSRTTEKHRNQAKSFGVDVYLTKPFDGDVLIDHISKLLI